MKTLISNAALVLPEELIEHGWLLIEDEYILAIGEHTPPQSMMKHVERWIDAASCYLLPGLIDLHSDAIEKLVEPRPNIFFELSLALKEADRWLAGCGITTEFHAVTLDDNEFGARSDAFAQELARAIKMQAQNDPPHDLLARHKIHARLELSSQRGSAIITRMIAAGDVALVSLMDHSPGQGQYTTEQAYRDYMLRTTGKSGAEVDAIIALKRQQASAIPQRITTVTDLAREAGLPVATHDDDTVEKVNRWFALGVKISEFPTTMQAAARAHELGLAVCMGAPNALRGQSSGGNLSAVEAIQAGVVDILCVDFYPPAMLGAVFALASRNILTLPQAVQLITLHPANATGSGHLVGSLAPGKVADLITVCLDQQGIPTVQSVFVGGRERINRYMLP